MLVITRFLHIESEPQLQKTSVFPILESIVANIEDSATSTHSLLLKCLEVAELLDVSSSEKSWITQELTGYEHQSETSKMELPSFKQAPHYRWLELSGRYDIIQPSKTFNTVGQFAVCFPCDYLENATSSISLKTTLVIKPENMWEKLTRGTIVATAQAELPVSRIKPIVQSIRGFVYKFAVTNLISLQFSKSVSGIIDNTRNLVASRLRFVSESLLRFINETLDSHKRTTEGLHWRVALENIRTILRRFTGLILKDAMLIDTRPKEGETSKKVELIIKWCMNQLKGGSRTELDSLKKESILLLDLINKPIHGEIDEVSKNEVERILLRSLIWMAGIIDILDQSGYTWVPEEISSGSE